MVWFHTMNAHPQVKSPPDRAFKALRQFNTEDGRRLAGRKDRMAPFWDEWFPSENLTDRFARALSKRYAIDMKEFCEAFEFFARVRRSLRRSTVVDLCAGHGLTGILFALLSVQWTVFCWWTAGGQTPMRLSWRQPRKSRRGFRGRYSSLPNQSKSLLSLRMRLLSPFTPAALGPTAALSSPAEADILWRSCPVAIRRAAMDDARSRSMRL